MKKIISIVSPWVLLTIFMLPISLVWANNSNGENDGYAHHDSDSGHYDDSHDRWEWRGPHRSCHVKGKHYHKHYGGNGNSTGELSCSNAKAVPRTLWPANHKFTPIDIRGMNTIDGSDPVVTIQCVYQDEPLNGVGDGNTDIDAKLSSSGRLKLRKERASRRRGNGNGRVYHVDFKAQDIAAGESCQGSVAVEVPHRWWGKAKDDGRLYVSLDNGFNCGGDDNQPPVIASDPVLTAMELKPYEYAVIATDPENDTLGYRLLEAPTAMDITADGIIQWTPEQGDVGSYTITVEVNDGDNAIEQSFTLTVSARDNTPPVITSSPVLEATEEQSYEYQLTALDNENDSFGFSLASGPLGLSVSFDGLVQWTPNEGQAGTHEVTVEVIDGLGAAGTQSYTISVSAKPNNAPEILSAPVTTVNEDALYQYTVLATDPEGTNLTYRLVEAPTGLALTDNVLNWTTTFDDSGEYPVTIEVEDAEGATASQTFLLTVVDINRPPLFTSVPTLTVAENTLYQYTPEATDDDGDVIIIELISGPTGMLLNADGVIEWTPTYDDAGLYDIEITADDGRGGVASDQFQITVTNTNRDPQITSMPIELATENTLYSYQVEASDDDEQDVIFSLVESPDGMTINDEGLIEWTPEFDDAGDIPVEVAVTDSETTISQAFIIVVVNTNQLPVAVDQALTIVEDTPATITLEAADGDADTLTYTINTTSTLGAAVLTDAQVDYTPPANSVGVDSFTFVANDGSGDSESATVSITITAVNDAPVISFIPPLTGQENTPYTADVNASDVEGDLLMFSLITAPTGMTIDGSTGVINWLPGFDQAGDRVVTVAVTDALGASDTFSFTIAVANVNQRPIASDLVVQADEDTATTVTLVGSDNDGDAITYSVINQPANGLLSGAVPNLIYTPNANFNAVDSFTYQVNDGVENSVAGIVTLTVNAVNDIPVVQPISVVMFADSSEAITLLGSDIDGDTLTFAISAQPTNGGVVINNNIATYTPAIGYIGSDSFVYVANDGVVDSALAVVSITVNALNNAPVITSIPLEVGEEGVQFMDQVIATDPDGDAISFELLEKPDGIDINGLTGEILWDNPVPGEYPIEVRVSDIFDSETLLSYNLFITGALPDQTSEGTDFWLMFNNNQGADNLIVYLSAVEQASVNVQIAGLGFNQDYVVDANQVISVDLTDQLINEISRSGIRDNGVHISSDKPITAYAINKQANTTDATILHPTVSLGTEYVIASYIQALNSLASHFRIVATEDNTQVTIIPSEPFTDGIVPNVRTRGEEVQLFLNAGQTLQVQGASVLNGNLKTDLSGTTVQSDKPVAVFAGNVCSAVATSAACDHLYEQLLPLEALGAEYFTLPLATRIGGDTFKIYAAYDNTLIQINDRYETILQAGEHYTTLLEEASHIQSTKPIQLMQLANSQDFDGVLSDPFMTYVPAAEQFISAYQVATPADGFANHFLNIVSRARSKDLVRVDGQPIDPALWQTIQNTEFVGTQVEVVSGVHRINGIEPFGLTIYGFNEYDSYGYLGGLAFPKLLAPASLQLVSTNTEPRVGEEVCINTIVTGLTAEPVSQVQVEFLVTNANEALVKKGTSLTSLNGETAFCYTRGLITNDHIEVSVEGINQQADIEWLENPDTAGLSPVIETVPYMYAVQGELYTYDVIASDPNGDDLTYTLLESPSGMTIDSLSGLINWPVPGSLEIGDIFPLEIEVTDTTGLSAVQKINLNGSLPILAPSIEPTIIGWGTESFAVRKTLRAIDRNRYETFNWSVDQNHGDGGFATGNSEFAWTVSPAVAGHLDSLNVDCRVPGSTLERMEVNTLWQDATTRVIRPVVGPLYDSNQDGELTGEDRIAIVGSGMGSFVYALDASTGEIIWRRDDAQGDFRSMGALIDIDGDQSSEYIYINGSTGHVVALNSDGTTRWTSSSTPVDYPTLNENYVLPADLNSDGLYEILVGPAVYDVDGQLLWSFDPSLLLSAGVSAPMVLDVDGDGFSEVFFGNEMRSHQGDLIRTFSGVDNFQFSSHFAYGNFDSDAALEIVISDQQPTGHHLRLIDDDGSLLWKISAGATMRIHTADFDLDGQSEIYSSNIHTMFDGDGEVLWEQSGFWRNPGAAVLDLDADGVLDIARFESRGLTVYDGESGSLSTVIAAPGITGNTTLPVFVDTNNDGSGELVIGGFNPIQIFEGAVSDWLPASSAYSHAFQNNGAVSDAMRFSGQSVPYFGVAGLPNANLVGDEISGRLSDVYVRYVTANPIAGNWEVEIAIGNRGLQPVGAGVVVEIYKDDSADLSNKIQDVSLPALAVGETNSIHKFQVSDPTLLGNEIFAVISDASIPTNECETVNHVASASTFIIRVEDSDGLSDTETWSIGGFEDNRAPVFNSIPITSAIAGEEYVYTANAVDSNTADSVRYFLNNAPNGASINASTGEIRWIPPRGSDGASFLISAQDLGRTAANQSFFVTVQDNSPENTSPQFISTPVTTISINEEYLYRLMATDSDDVHLTYSMLTAPAGMSINALTGEIFWQPTAEQVGDNPVTVVVSDTGGADTQQTFTISVLDNFVPQITSTAPNNVSRGQVYTYQLSAFDVDGDILIYSLPVSPFGMSISDDGLIHWDTTDVALGAYGVEVTVSDETAQVIQSFTVVVTEDSSGGTGGEGSLKLSAVPKTVAFASEVYSFFAAGVSNEPGPVIIALVSAPDGMTITQDQPFDGFYQIDWLPDEANCQHDVTLQLTDSVGTTEQVTFTIDVYNAPKRLNRFQCSVDAEFCPTR